MQPTIPEQPKIVGLTIRMPEILKLRIDGYVRKRKATEPKYSLNDFWLEAGRAHVDRTAAPVVQVWQPPSHDVGVEYPGEPVQVISAAEQRKAIDHARAAEAPFGKSVTDLLVSKAQQPSAEPYRKAPTRPWLPELIRIQAMYEVTPEDGLEEYQSMTQGMSLPSDLRTFQPGDRRMLAKRAERLDQNRPLPAAPAAESGTVDGW